MVERIAIPGYEGIYEIDMYGNVYCVLNDKYHKPRILKPFINDSGYLRINLRDAKHKAKKHYIHKLVAQAFIPNPNGFDRIDHKDCNKLNNSVDNLEWVTQKENINRALENGLERQYFCIVDGIKYVSMADASRQIFNKKWLIKELRYKYGNEFDYCGHHIKVVILNDKTIHSSKRCLETY